MGVEDQLEGAHRYYGLRANGFGKTLEMRWPEHPHFPNYGYTITRHDLDGIVVERAAKAGVTVFQGTEALAPILGEPAEGAALPECQGATVRDREAGTERELRAAATWSWPTVPCPASGAALGTSRDRSLPRHGHPRVLHVAAPRRALDREPPRYPRRRGHGGAGYGWIFPPRPTAG